LNRSLKIVILSFFFNAVAVGAWGCGKDKPPDPSPTPTGPAPATKVYSIQVSRHVTALLDEARADLILRDASAVLQVRDSPEDVVCPVELRRAGGVTTFTVSNGSVNSEADYRAILALPGQVKVVNQINWCGGFKANIIGCAPTPGNSLIVVRHALSEEGILWGHEFGHNRGLIHRVETTAMMHEAIGPDRRSVNEAECRAFQE
jgi:hypothetical protein